MINVLIIDDNQAILNYLRVFLMQQGKYAVHILQNSKESYKILDSGQFDILILDMDMPVVSGLDILKHIEKEKINITTIVLTGVEDIDLAISAMKLGTFDYLLKPLDNDKLLSVMDSALSKQEIEKEEVKEKASLKKKLKHIEAFRNIITHEEKMYELLFMIEKYAQADNSILIWGESGTGKELIARAIHEISNRKDKKFIAVNAGSFANELFVSEFFGHSKGSFTGASSEKKGFIEVAKGGTLFLDEIGELSVPIQVKLLRFLQEEEFYRLGSTENIKSDVRIIAATNKNLFEEIKNGNFRKDLFFRLNIHSVSLPPLRERPDDIMLLAHYFLDAFNQKYGKDIKGFSKTVQKYLQSYTFPGNIRELKNIINSSIIIEHNNEINKKSLPHYLLENNEFAEQMSSNLKPLSMKEIERKHIKKVLKYTSNNRTKAAEILEISRVSLISKIKKYGLD